MAMSRAKKAINNKKFTSNKPVYKKKKTPLIIGNEVAKSKKIIKEEIVKVEPSQKCKSIIDDLKKKGFFVDARAGFKVNVSNVKEWHLDTKKDIPVVLVEITKPSKFNNGVVKYRYVYRIIRYNSNEIVGLHSDNTNVYQMKTLNV